LGLIDPAPYFFGLPVYPLMKTGTYHTIKELFFLYKAKAKARIYLEGKAYNPGFPIEFTEDQLKVLKPHVTGIEKVEEKKGKGKADKPSPKGKNKDKE
jgi:hypothetical protein